jgi:hypothetical protein
MQGSSGSFYKVRELPFQDQAPDHPGSCGVLLEWWHPRFVHAPPHIPVRNPHRIREIWRLVPSKESDSPEFLLGPT